MKPAAIVDIETEDWVTFVAGAIAYLDPGGNVSRYQDFRWSREADYVDALLAIEGEVWAHNGGRFDYLWLLDHLDRRGIKATIHATSAGVTSIKVGKTQFLDSFRVFPESLAAISNGAKLGTGFTCEGLRPECAALKAAGKADGCGGYCQIRRNMPESDWRKLLEYLRGDCEALAEALRWMRAFAVDAGLRVGRTVGGTAWRSASYELGLPDFDESTSAFMYLRDGYYGGRCQKFTAETGVHYQYDVNSMYPSRLALTNVPVGRSKRVQGADARIAFDAQIPGIYRARATVPHCRIPPLPFRAKGRIAYPVGTFEGTWALPELIRAAECGVKVEPLHARIFETQAIIYAPWVERLWGLRARHGKKSREGRWLKWIMNSLTGKLGSKPERSRIVLNPKYEDLKACKCAPGQGCRCGALKPLGRSTHVWISTTEWIHQCAHAQHAAYLTAESRVELHKQLTAYGGNDALYCDTDSCFTTRERFPGYDRIGPNLGEWSNEGVWDDWVAWAPKVYWHTRIEDGKLVAKAKGVHAPTPETLISKITGGQEVRSEAMLGFKTAARTGLGYFIRESIGRLISPGFGDRIGLPGDDSRPPDFDKGEVETV